MPLKIYGVARTDVACFEFKNKLGLDVALKAAASGTCAKTRAARPTAFRATASRCEAYVAIPGGHRRDEKSNALAPMPAPGTSVRQIPFFSTGSSTSIDSGRAALSVRIREVRLHKLVAHVDEIARCGAGDQLNSLSGADKDKSEPSWQKP
jgi:hypothetical protein